MSESDKDSYVLNVDPSKMLLLEFAYKASEAITKAAKKTNRGRPHKSLMFLCANLLNIVCELETEGTDDVLVARAMDKIQTALTRLGHIYPMAKEFVDKARSCDEDEA